jgi:hypothetical protein
MRIAYGGGGWKKMLLRAICGALTLTAVSALDYFNLPGLSIAIGGALGFVGVEQVKVMASWCLILALEAVMQTSDKGIALIKQFEGCKLTAYQDSVGCGRSAMAGLSLSTANRSAPG